MNRLFLMGLFLSAFIPSVYAKGVYDDAQIQLVANLIYSDEIVDTIDVVTRNGFEITNLDEDHFSYLAKAEPDLNTGDLILTTDIAKIGYSFSATPLLRSDGKIDINLSVIKRELVSIDQIKRGSITTEKPNIFTARLDQKLTLDENREISIPFDKYILKLSASRY